MKIEDLYYDISNSQVSEENLDIEKWRRENPMDYFKAIFLIMTESENRDEVFNIIYKITRLYIPHTLFKYYSLTDNMVLNEQKLETLQQKNIFMSDVKYMNDPFDNKAYYYQNEKLKKYDRLAKFDGKLIDDFSSYVKISALTSNHVNSMPMWAHYANNHAGFCVSYDMQINTELSGCTFPVQYTDKRIDITSLMDQQAQKIFRELGIQTAQGKKEIRLTDLSLIYMTSFFCNIKHVSWSYENEFRCTVGATAENMPYMPATPKEIYIGMNCPLTYRDRIIKIAKEMQVPVFMMKFDEFNQEFNLVSEKI